MAEKKRIGVVTLPPITNYGGILQAYALQIVLDRMGFESEIIEKRLYPKRLSFIEKCFIYPYRFFKKKVLHKNCQIKYEELRYEASKWRYEASKFTTQFVDKNIRHRHISDFRELKENDYCFIVVGSDQIWRPKYLRVYGINLEDAFLGFAKGWPIKRISYAASFGSEQWEYNDEETCACKGLLSKFDAVSCREDSGEVFCKLYFGYNEATTVLDPTLLLDKEDYLSLCEGLAFEHDKGLMCYVLDKNECSEKTVGLIHKELGCDLFEVRAKSTSGDASIEEKTQPPVEKWIMGFKNADFVVTDSFHACVFSILFQKPFVVIVNHDRGVARFNSLLGLFGLNYRMVDGFDEAKIKTILSTPLVINQEVLNAKKEQSLSFLKKNLGGVGE